jgi:hypothetical protein
MKTVLIALVSVGFCVTVSTAADVPENAQHFETKKAEVLKHIDQRLSHIQEEKACVQAAASHDALRACKDKFRAEIKQDRQTRKP